jgi:ATP-binding cassette subfamily B protein
MFESSNRGDRVRGSASSRPERQASELALYLRLLRQARPYWPHVAGLLGLSLLTTPLALLQPLPLKLAIDSIIGSQPLPQLLRAIVPSAMPGSGAALVVVVSLLILVALLTHLQELANSVLRSYTGDRLTIAFRAQLFRHLQRLSLTFHDSRGSADSLYRVLSDAPSIQYIAIEGVIPFITASVTLVTMTYVIVRIDWQLALVALTVGPLIAVLSHQYRGRLRRQSRAVKKAESSAQSVVQEVLQSVRVVKAFGQEDREEERFRRFAGESLKARIRLTLAEGGYGVLSGVSMALGTGLVLYVGVHHVRAGIISLGDLLLVLGYLNHLYSPIKTIGKRAASLASHLTSAERAFAVLDEAPDVAERPGARPLKRAAGAIAFRDVRFGYDKTVAVLSSVTFEVPAGSCLGISGATGVGKTTLVNLLTRFYDPTAGQILLDGVDLRDYRLVDLRNQFAMVLQDPVLFSTSILENIAYGRPGASETEIVNAAKAANAHSFIERMPDAYETVVGERGMRLSGGERQRISLARAFLKDAPILILDEPTSSVDTATELLIMESMHRLMSGRTTVMITHRVGTLSDCDMVVSLQAGGVVHITSPPRRDGAAVVAASRR